MPYLYILKSLKNSTYYVGSTIDLQRRLKEHASGKSKYTRHILPIELVFSQKYKTLRQARRAEYWLKKLKSKRIIEQIISEGKFTKEFS